MSDKKDALVVSGDALPDVLRDGVPRLVDAQMLVKGLRLLQQRIPDYTQLSPEEVRSLIRVAYLDPEFRENGLRAAEVCSHTKLLTGRSAEELRGEDAVIREWDEVERELTIVLKGISAANLKRKHHLGKALLKLYDYLRITVKRSERNLRPYFDAMKEAYLRRRKKPAKAEVKTKAEAENETAKE